MVFPLHPGSIFPPLIFLFSSRNTGFMTNMLMHELISCPLFSHRVFMLLEYINHFDSSFLFFTIFWDYLLVCPLYGNTLSVQGTDGPRFGGGRAAPVVSICGHLSLGRHSKRQPVGKREVTTRCSKKLPLSSLTHVFTAENSSQPISTGGTNPPIPHASLAPSVTSSPSLRLTLTSVATWFLLCKCKKTRGTKCDSLPHPVLARHLHCSLPYLRG